MCHSKNVGKTPRNVPNCLFPLQHADPSNTPMPGPTTLTTPNKSSISSHTSTQLCNKVPIGYTGTPQIHPENCPIPFDNCHLYLTPIIRLITTYHPKRHWDPLNNFATIHFSDRQTDQPSRRPTGGIGNTLVSKRSMLTILIESDVLKIAVTRYTVRKWTMTYRPLSKAVRRLSSNWRELGSKTPSFSTLRAFSGRASRISNGCHIQLFMSVQIFYSYIFHIVYYAHLTVIMQLSSDKMWQNKVILLQ